MNINGTSGNDTLTGTGKHDLFNLTAGGEDTAKGLAGDDNFLIGGALDTGDRLDGGSGDDTVVLSGNYAGAHALDISAAMITNIEEFDLNEGNNYDLTFAAGAIDGDFKLDALDLGKGDSLTATTAGDHTFTTIGGAGNDVITAGAAHDVIDLSAGGNDTVTTMHNGHFVSETEVYMGAALTAADIVHGASVVLIEGNYSGTHALTLNGNFSDVSELSLGPGSNYDITTADASVSAGFGFDIDGGILNPGDTLTFNGSAETNGFFDVAGGAGDDSLTGGKGNDIFDVTQGGNDTVNGGAGNDTIIADAELDARDSIDGGTGNDTLTLANKDYDLSLKNLRNIDTLQLGDANSYSFTTSDATVAAGATMTVDASSMPTGFNLTFDGSAEKDGGFHIKGGLGDVNFTGGAGNDIADAGPGEFLADFSKGGNDTFHGNGLDNSIAYMAAAMTAADTISNAGEVQLNGEYTGAHKLVLGAHTITGSPSVALEAGHDYDITLNAATAKNLSVPMQWAADELGAHDSLTLDGSADTTNALRVYGGLGDDVIAGSGVGDDLYSGTGGKDHISGGAGDDTISFGLDYASSDRIDGGTGNDTLIFTNGGTFTLTNNITSVETLEFTDFNSYTITENDGNVANGATLTVDGEFLGLGGTSLTFYGGAESNGNFDFIGGGGNDTLAGGKGNDSFDGGLGADRMEGGAGKDTFIFADPSESTSVDFDSISDFSGSADRIALPVQVKGFQFSHFGGTLDASDFDTELGNAMQTLQKFHAAEWTPDTGDYANDHFLIIDGNGHPGYQAGEDYVIVVDATTIHKSDFILIGG